MKLSHSVDMFISDVRSVAAHRGICRSSVGEAHADQERVRLMPFAGRADLRAAPVKDKTNNLPDETKLELWCSPCYLCGRSPALGIDRMDSAVGYTVENARPCCTDCNYMKKDLSLDDFAGHIGHIVRHTRFWVLYDVTSEPLTESSGKTREPVAVVGADGLKILVFPSIGCAAKVTGVGAQSIKKALESEPTRSGGQRVWVRSDAAQYRAQAVSYADCLVALQLVRMQ
jgi:hypothetical protein